MLQHLIIQFPLYNLSSCRLRKVKNRGKFWTFTSKSDCGKLTRGGRLQVIPNIVIWRGNFWYFGKLVAEERWSQPEVPLYSFFQIIWILYTTQEWPTPITISDKTIACHFFTKGHGTVSDSLFPSFLKKNSMKLWFLRFTTLLCQVFWEHKAAEGDTKDIPNPSPRFRYFTVFWYFYVENLRK